MTNKIIKITTLIMLFIGFPIIIYIMCSLGGESFTPSKWENEYHNNPLMGLFCVTSIISIIIGIITINTDYINDLK